MFMLITKIIFRLDFRLAVCTAVRESEIILENHFWITRHITRIFHRSPSFILGDSSFTWVPGDSRAQYSWSLLPSGSRGSSWHRAVARRRRQKWCVPRPWRWCRLSALSSNQAQGFRHSHRSAGLGGLSFEWLLRDPHQWMPQTGCSANPCGAILREVGATLTYIGSNKSRCRANFGRTIIPFWWKFH